MQAGDKHTKGGRAGVGAHDLVVLLVVLLQAVQLRGRPVLRRRPLRRRRVPLLHELHPLLLVLLRLLVLRLGLRLRGLGRAARLLHRRLRLWQTRKLRQRPGLWLSLAVPGGDAGAGCGAQRRLRSQPLLLLLLLGGRGRRAALGAGVPGRQNLGAGAPAGPVGGAHGGAAAEPLAGRGGGGGDGGWDRSRAGARRRRGRGLAVRAAAAEPPRAVRGLRARRREAAALCGSRACDCCGLPRADPCPEPRRSRQTVLLPVKLGGPRYGRLTRRSLRLLGTRSSARRTSLLQRLSLLAVRGIRHGSWCSPHSAAADGIAAAQLRWVPRISLLFSCAAEHRRLAGAVAGAGALTAAVLPSVTAAIAAAIMRGVQDGAGRGRGVAIDSHPPGVHVHRGRPVAVVAAVRGRGSAGTVAIAAIAVAIAAVRALRVQQAADAAVQARRAALLGRRVVVLFPPAV